MGKEMVTENEILLLIYISCVLGVLTLGAAVVELVQWWRVRRERKR